jgi:hypothetical protein
LAGLNYEFRVGRDDVNAGQDVPDAAAIIARVGRRTAKRGPAVAHRQPFARIGSVAVLGAPASIDQRRHERCGHCGSQNGVQTHRKILSASGRSESLKMREMVRGLMYLREPRAERVSWCRHTRAHLVRCQSGSAIRIGLPAKVSAHGSPAMPSGRPWPGNATHRSTCPRGKDLWRGSKVPGRTSAPGSRSSRAPMQAHPHAEGVLLRLR